MNEIVKESITDGMIEGFKGLIKIGFESIGTDIKIPEPILDAVCLAVASLVVKSTPAIVGSIVSSNRKDFNYREKLEAERVQQVLGEFGKLLASEGISGLDVEKFVDNNPNILRIIDRIMMIVRDESNRGKAKYFAKLIKNSIISFEDDDFYYEQQEKLAEILGQVGEVEIKILNKMKSEIMGGGIDDERWHMFAGWRNVDSVEFLVSGKYASLGSGLDESESKISGGYIEGLLENMNRLGIMQKKMEIEKNNIIAQKYKPTEFTVKFMKFCIVEGE